MNFIKKALLTVLCVLISSQCITVSVSAEQELSYVLDYTTIDGDNLEDYISAIQVIKNNGQWQVWVTEGSDKRIAGSFSGSSGTVTYSPSNIYTRDVSISVDINSKTATVTWQNKVLDIKNRYVTVKIYPSPLSEDTTMRCEIYLDGTLKETRKKDVNSDGSVSFGSYSVSFSGTNKIKLDSISINSSGTASVVSQQIEGGVITKQMGDGTRQLEVFMEAYVPAQELELNYLEAMRMLDWNTAKAATAHYSNEEINTALNSGRLILKNNGTGLTHDSKLRTTITIWERLNNGAIEGDGIYNVNTKPRTVQVICQYYDTNTTDCSEVKSLTRYWAVINSTFKYSTIQTTTGTKERNVNKISYKSSPQTSFPQKKEGVIIQARYRTQTKTNTGWIAYADMEAKKKESNYSKVENYETRDASRFGYYLKGTWTDSVLAVDAPSYFWYSGYEVDYGAEMYRFRYADVTAKTDWTTSVLSGYDQTVSKVQKRSCNTFKSNGSKCGYTDWTSWSDWSTTKQDATALKEVQTRTYTRYRTRTATAKSCAAAGCDTYKKDATKCGTFLGIAKRCEEAGCETYNTSGDKCGYTYSDWTSWSSWVQRSCTTSDENTKQCGSYKEYRTRTRSEKSCVDAGCATWSDWTTASCEEKTNETQCRTVYKYYSLDWSNWTSWSSSSSPPSYIVSKDKFESQTTQYVRARTSEFKWTDWMPDVTTCTGSKCPDEIVRTQKYSDVNGTPYQAKGTVYTNNDWSEWEDVPSSVTTGYAKTGYEYTYRTVKKEPSQENITDLYVSEGEPITIGTLTKQTESTINYQKYQMNQAYAGTQLLEEIKSGIFQEKYNELGNTNITWDEYSTAKSQNNAWYQSTVSSSVSGDNWLKQKNFVPYIYIRSHYRAEYTTETIAGYSGEGNMTVSITEKQDKIVDKSANGDLVLDSGSYRNTKVIYFDYNQPLKQYEDNLPANWDEETYDLFITAMQHSVANEYEGEIRVVMSLNDIQEMKEYLIDHPDSLGDCDFLRHFARIFETTSDELRSFLDGSGSCRLGG